MSGPTLSSPVGSSSPGSDRAELPVSGVTAFTTIDFPGKLSAVLYTQGCAWRCRYCHNAALWSFGQGHLRWDALLAFLGQRTGFLDAVVFSGGEPTAHAALKQAILDVKKWGFLIGLHTAGMFPERLREVIGLCDWVGMDVKAPFADYEKITGVRGSGEAARESVELVLKSGVANEFRTTFHPDLIDPADLLRMAEKLRSMGVENYALQVFRRTGCPDAGLRASVMSAPTVTARAHEDLKDLFPSFELRS